MRVGGRRDRQLKKGCQEDVEELYSTTRELVDETGRRKGRQEGIEELERTTKELVKEKRAEKGGQKDIEKL